MPTQPLLLKAFYNNANTTANGTSVPVAAATSWNNITPTGRGDLVAVDLLNSQPIDQFQFTPNGQATVSIGGTGVFLKQYMGSYNYASDGMWTDLRQAGGQTIQCRLEFPTAFAIDTNVFVLGYFDNPWNTQEVRAAVRASKKLKQRRYDLVSIYNDGIKSNVKTYTVPKGMGNVVGIQLIAGDNKQNLSLQNCIGQVSIDGVTVLEDIPANLGAYNSRKNPIYPIVFQGGNQIQIDLDTSNVSAASFISFGIRLFFDDDLAGNKTYEQCKCSVNR